MPAGRRYDRVLVLSRSGTTTEILQLLGRLRGTVPTVAITAAARTPVAEAADAVDRAELRRRGVRGADPVRHHRAGPAPRAPGPRPRAGRPTRPSGCWPQPLPPELLAARQFTFLGTGWTYGLANEAALKLREAAGMWTEAYPAMEYRHGPIAVTGPGSVVWLFGAAAGRAGR